MRILCVFGMLERGGAETMCMNLYRAIDRTKIQFDFVKHTPQKGAYEDEILSLGGRIYEAPRYKSYNRGAYCKWWKNHLQQHPEHQIIHGHFFSISAIYFKVAKAMGRVTVGHSHSTQCVGSAIKRMTKLRLVRKAYRYTDVALACSRDAGQWMFPKMSYDVLNNAIETERFVFDPQRRLAIRAQLGIDLDALVLGTVGNLNGVKNPFFMIETVKAICQRCADVRFLWIGEGPLRAQIEERLQAEGLSETVILAGARADVPDLMQAMDVFVFPSLWEGLGMAAVEAQAAGLPCLCSENVPAEAAVTPLCQFLPTDDPQVWAETILSMKQPRSDMSEQIAAAGYDVRQTAQWLQDLYLRCLNG